MIVFLISGLWHRADWLFVIMGSIHGLYQIYEISTAKIRKKLWNYIRLDGTKIQWFIKWAITMSVILLTWIFFRAENLHDALYIITKIWTDIISLDIIKNIGNNVRQANFGLYRLIIVFMSILLLEFNHVLEEKYNLNYFSFMEKYPVIRWAKYYIIIFWILLFSSLGATEYIYFQF
jgi:D-alanyl-lipoteichoic acid acyltransferase DltB (MBOAT superfamily)